MHHTQQARQIGTIGNILAIAVNDLTEERDFLDALLGKRTDLRDNVAHRTAALHAASEWDNAECAGVRTTIDNGHMRADKIAALVLRKDKFVIHHQEAAGSFGIFQRTDFALAQKRDKR